MWVIIYIYIIYTSQSVFGVLGFIYVYYIHCIYIYAHTEYGYTSDTNPCMLRNYLRIHTYEHVYICIYNYNIYIHILADRYV